MNIEEVEEPKKYENLQTKPVLDPFKSTADHLKVRELARKTNIEEVEEPETTKIYRQNPLTPAAATRKLREFTDETNMQARKHENSDEFCAPPVRHLDLATRPFTITVRTPSVKHTVWGILVWVLYFSGIYSVQMSLLLVETTSVQNMLQPTLLKYAKGQIHWWHGTSDEGPWRIGWIIGPRQPNAKEL